MTPVADDCILEMRGIVKRFPPVTALGNVTFRVRRGTVHALCGENGAGKSTLMKILSGVYRPDGGSIFLDGRETDFRSPADAIDAGISMLYQELELASDLSVYENVFLGREIIGNRLLGKVDSQAEILAVRKLIDEYGFHLDPEAILSGLSPGECQIVELVKALMRNARIIVMDEPTSSLSESEARILFRIIRELKARGISIIYISHRMEEVSLLADDVSVLRDGVVVCSAPARELGISDIIRHMVGRDVVDFYPKRSPNVGDVVFEAKDLSSDNGIRDVSFTVRAGEIVGMAGLVGAGRSETARAIFGVDAKTSGRCLLDGRELDIRSPGDAIRAGIALLTEDRKRTGLCANLPCSLNITLPNYGKIGMRHVLDLARERAMAEELGDRTRLKWSSPDAPADSLSGGNQQKVLLARWLMANSRFMIFDEPTRGIDVNAKKEIYNHLCELSAAGCAILVISSDLPELFGITDRIIVMRDKRIVGERRTVETSPEEVMKLAACNGDDRR